MPKRRLSERQMERIGRIQERRRRRVDERAQARLRGAEESQACTGLVVVRHGANLAVESSDAGIHHCLVRQNIGEPVCGDQVVWQPTGPGSGVVTAILERRTLLSRTDYSGRQKPLAANLTQLLIVLAPKPEPSEYLVDQYLVAAELMRVRALIAFNKVDLLDAAELAGHRRRLAHYEQIGYPSVWMSLADGKGLGPLGAMLADETSILVGQSGVGKSSLVKALLPDRRIQIGRLSQATGLGRHTTSAATCYRLPGGGRLIDSPGVRSFRLGGIGSDELQMGFRELVPLLGRCRFANCRHHREPGCELQQAVADGRVHPRRLANFLHLARTLEDAAARH